jgi:hypothetical protein
MWKVIGSVPEEGWGLIMGFMWMMLEVIDIWGSYFRHELEGIQLQKR